MNRSKIQKTALPSAGAPDAEVEEVVDPLSRNIHSIADLHARFEQQASPHQIVVERVTLWLGRPTILYSVLAIVVCWIVANLVIRSIGLRPLDPPPFSWLQGMVSLFALLMTIVVLITQNRQGRVEKQRNELELQINLLTEQRTAKIIALLEELRRDMPIVPSRVDAEAEALIETVDPHVVLTALEYKLDQALADEPDMQKLAPNEPTQMSGADGSGRDPQGELPNQAPDLGDENRVTAGEELDSGPEEEPNTAGRQGNES